MISGKTVFPELEPSVRRAKLALPSGRIRAVMDTDTFNEIDDQFAVSMAMLAPEKFDMRAITAAPFFNANSSGPADGMEKSYEEILRLLKLLRHAPENFAFRGSTGYLPDRDTPLDSPAARRIVELAHEADRDGETLYILAIGAITNVASALLLDPAIAAMTVVVWLGGHPVRWPHNREFNLYQDIPAAQVVLDCGVPLIRIPCLSVAELLLIGRDEIAARCMPTGPLGKFLAGRTLAALDADSGYSRTIWDISTAAYFLVPEAFDAPVVPTPVLVDDGPWRPAPARHEYVEVRHISRDPVFDELFRRLARAPR